MFQSRTVNITIKTNIGYIREVTACKGDTVQLKDPDDNIIAEIIIGEIH